MEILIVGTLTVVIIGIGIMAGRASHKKMIEAMRALAVRQGLQLHDAEGMFAKPYLAGQKSGRQVRIWSFTTGAGKSRQHWAAAGVSPHKLGNFSFDLRPQGVMSKLAEIFGAKEAVTGDRQFDAKWFLQTNAPTALSAALVPEIRAKLDVAFAAGARGHFRTERGMVCYVESGTLISTGRLERLESLLPLLRDLADVAEVCAPSVES